MLIRNAEIEGVVQSVRIERDKIAAIGQVEPTLDEEVIDARGGALLPGLHDHHIHLFALAARQASVVLGPPEISDAAQFAERLAAPGTGWLRGIGYHESVAGMLDRGQLDQIAPNRPVRIQHRGGRMWFLNSVALDDLLARAPEPPGLDQKTGQLFNEDRWLRETLGSQMPDLSDVSQSLAAYGITGVTDMSPSNDHSVAAFMAGERARGALSQSVLLAGQLSLAEAPLPMGVTLSPAKLHLHETSLPDHDASIAFARAAHESGRPVAIHCVTEVELVFALSILEAAGPHRGDRIEHASVTPDPLLHEIQRLGLTVVAQPLFVEERGDSYLADIPETDWPSLYRLRAFREAGVTLAAGSDAPFASPDPWASMRAAVERTTAGGAAFGRNEALTPEEALSLYLPDPVDLRRQRRIAVGGPADICLLDRNWAAARGSLSADHVRLTIGSGTILYNRVDQAPVERGARADPSA